MVLNESSCHNLPIPDTRRPGVISPAAAEFWLEAARPWNACSGVLGVSARGASLARRERAPASQSALGQWDFSFWPGSAGTLSPTLFLGGALV